MIAYAASNPTSQIQTMIRDLEDLVQSSRPEAWYPDYLIESAGRVLKAYIYFCHFTRQVGKTVQLPVYTKSFGKIALILINFACEWRSGSWSKSEFESEMLALLVAFAKGPARAYYIAIGNTDYAQQSELAALSNCVSQSYFCCPQPRGLKADLLLLKITLQVKLAETAELLELIGVPLEFFFAEHMLSMYSTMFNPGLTARLWDILITEGASGRQVLTPLLR
jgi:hypothetical protein